jgi:hypothetical protein
MSIGVNIEIHIGNMATWFPVAQHPSLPFPKGRITRPSLPGATDSAIRFISIVIRHLQGQHFF